MNLITLQEIITTRGFDFDGGLLAYFIPLIFIFAAWFFLIRRAKLHMKSKKLPKYNAIDSSQLQHFASKQSLRDLSGSIDVAIIGSGIGALSNAAVLARQGFKVAVFEQNSVVGGCTHTFTKDNFTFDTGVHYVGGMSSVVKNLYDQISDGQLKWNKIDKTYDVIYNGTTGERIEMTDDHDLNRKVLTEHFGIKAESWKRFDRAKFCAKFWSYVVFQLKLWHPLVLRLAWPFMCLPYRRYALRSTIEVLRECGFSSQAAGALTYHWGEITLIIVSCLLSVDHISHHLFLPSFNVLFRRSWKAPSTMPFLNDGSIGYVSSLYSAHLSSSVLSSQLLTIVLLHAVITKPGPISPEEDQNRLPKHS